MKAYRILFWLFALATVACFAAVGWLWWSERDVPRGQTRNVEVSVTNTSAETLNLAGLDGELC